MSDTRLRPRLYLENLLWKKVYEQLLEVPVDFRSRNHSNYLIEVKMRCEETQELINHMEKQQS